MGFLQCVPGPVLALPSRGGFGVFPWLALPHARSGACPWACSCALVGQRWLLAVCPCKGCWSLRVAPGLCRRRVGAALEMLHNPQPCVLEGKEGWKEDGWHCCGHGGSLQSVLCDPRAPWGSGGCHWISSHLQHFLRTWRPTLCRIKLKPYWKGSIFLRILLALGMSERSFFLLPPLPCCLVFPQGFPHYEAASVKRRHGNSIV